MSGRAGAVLLALAAAGCRAEVAGPPDLTPVYDFATDPPDMALGPDMVCPGGAENCSDGCDNDGNGYTDAEDPACSPTVVTVRAADGVVMRWRLDDNTLTPLLDLKVQGPYAPAYRRDVTPGELWLALDFSSSFVQRIRLSDGMVTWMRKDLHVRDVCFFGGTPILVQPTSTTAGALHLLKPDGTDAKTVMVSAGEPTACASDGKLLYVAVHAAAARGQFVVYDGNYAPVATLPMPPSLKEDRCLDLAWTSRGFYGLFADGMGMSDGDASLYAARAYPFAMDGGVGAPIDLPDGGDVVHAIGEFVP